jgi:hypothetical protein
MRSAGASALCLAPGCPSRVHALRERAESRFASSPGHGVVVILPRGGWVAKGCYADPSLRSVRTNTRERSSCAANAESSLCFA